MRQENQINFNNPIDISIPLRADSLNPLAWYLDIPKFEPVVGEGFIGLVSEGSSVNFRTLSINPHGHGTHTECLGHITKEIYSINTVLKRFFFKATLLTVQPIEVFNHEYQESDLIVTKELLEKALSEVDLTFCEAIIVRTLPNSIDKKHKNYSNTNPIYFHVSCVDILDKLNVKHFLTDLPSVDRETDGGKLLFHHAFWKVPENPDFERTITELIYVDNDVKDGKYLLNLQTASIENDATLSRPVLFEIISD